ncbi:MAG: hypothetical protein ABIH00_01525 [Armatimonadota bacterium]
MKKRFFLLTLLILISFFLTSGSVYSQSRKQAKPDWEIQQVILSTLQNGPAVQQLEMGDSVYVSVMVKNNGDGPQGTKTPNVFLNNSNNVFWNAPRTFPGPGQTQRVFLFLLPVNAQYTANNQFKVRVVIPNDGNNGNNQAEATVPVQQAANQDWQVTELIISGSQDGQALAQITPGQSIYVSAMIRNNGNAPSKQGSPQIYINNSPYWNAPRTYPGPNQTQRVFMFNIPLQSQFIVNNKFKVKINIGNDNVNGNNEAEVEYNVVLVKQ